jgi:Cu(I)/Ag(I) efflux system membrane fusion protein
MHPWIKSDKPGNCTICGMKLVPVYEGESTRDSSAETLVKLSSQSINVLQVETCAGAPAAAAALVARSRAD